MSNYHYNDQQNSKNNYSYTDVKHITDYECDQKCLCREVNERSDKDRLYYDFYVLNKPINLKSLNLKNKEKEYCCR